MLGDMLRTAVREAGALALTYVRSDLKHWTKGVDSPVSEADIAVDALLRQRLAGTGYVSILPVQSQHRGRLFLPFVDDDPRTAELLSKVLLLARDQEIKDPQILQQLR